MAGTFNGEIVVCNRGGIGRVEKGFNVLNAGASAMLLRNLITQDVETDNHFLPTVHLNGPAGDSLIAFLGSHTGVMATFTPGATTAALGDVMAGFSSRGGPAQTLGINKPDVTAPGVQILAGASPQHVDVPMASFSRQLLAPRCQAHMSLARVRLSRRCTPIGHLVRSNLL